MQDRDLQRLRVHAIGRRQRIDDAAHRCGAEVGRARAGAEDVAEAPFRDGVGNRAHLEIGHALQFRHLSRGEGEGGGIGAEHRRHAFHRHQATDLADRLVLVHRVALREADLPAEHAAGGVALLDRDLEPAEALIAQQREAAGEGIEGAELDLAPLGRGDARRDGGGGDPTQQRAATDGDHELPPGPCIAVDVPRPGPSWQAHPAALTAGRHGGNGPATA